MYPEAASTGLIPGAYTPLVYHKELTITSFLYAGALPKATVEAITTFLNTFADTQRHHLPPIRQKAGTITSDPLIQYYHHLASTYPEVGKISTPVVPKTTKYFHSITKAIITRIHDALIFRSSTMQRVITALVQRRQRLLN